MTNTNKTNKPEQPNQVIRDFFQDLIDIGKQNAKIDLSEENEVKTYRGGTNLGD